MSSGTMVGWGNGTSLDGELSTNTGSASLRIAIMVLELNSIVFLSILLLTPSRKHPVVNGFLITTILRSIVDVLPPIIYERFPNQFHELQLHSGLAKFCIGDAIVLRYFTVVRAAYGMSFMLPLLILAVKQGKHRCCLSEKHCHDIAISTSGVFAMCVAPYIWGLPTLVTPVPKLVNHFAELQPVFNTTSCAARDFVFQITSLVLILVPLAFAIMTALAFVIVLQRCCKLPLLDANMGIIDLARVIRFGALVAIIITSASLYSVLVATWVKYHEEPVVHTFLAISCVWEAVSSNLIFLIFAAQEDVQLIWRGWYHKVAECLTRSPHKHVIGREPSIFNYPRLTPYSLRMESWLCWHSNRPNSIPSDAEIAQWGGSMSIRNFNEVDGDLVACHNVQNHSLPHIPKRIISRPTSTRHYISPTVMPTSPHDMIPGLSPPPRPSKNKSSCNNSPIDDPMGGRTFRGMPSLTAIGGHDSCSAKQSLDSEVNDSYSYLDEDLAEDRGVNVSHSYVETVSRSQRPSTATSSRTFGSVI